MLLICEICRCVNGFYECIFIENCDEDLSKFKLIFNLVNFNL